MLYLEFFMHFDNGISDWEVKVEETNKKEKKKRWNGGSLGAFD